MPLFDVFDLAGSGMRAQSLRLNVTSSNLANAGSVAKTPEEAYRARHPVFSSLVMGGEGSVSTGVQVLGIVESAAPPSRRYQPAHPMADEQGYVYASNVNPIEEMVNMLSAARAFQSNVEILNTTKELMLGTLRIGQ